MSNEINNFLNRNIDDVIEIQRTLIDMIDEEYNYKYAEDTLRGILDVIERTGVVTSAQRRAVENIRRNPSRKYVRRRYR